MRITKTEGNPRVMETLATGVSVWAETEREYVAIFPEVARLPASGRRAALMVGAAGGRRAAGRSFGHGLLRGAALLCRGPALRRNLLPSCARKLCCAQYVVIENSSRGASSPRPCKALATP